MNTNSDEGFRQAALAHTDALYAFAYRLCGSASEAEDIVQETILKAHASCPSFDGRAPYRNWFFGILHDTWSSKQQREREDHATGEFDGAESVCEAAYTEMEAAVATFDMGRLAQVIDDHLKASLERLPDPFRAVLLLSTQEMFSYGEIAEITGVPVGAVMSRLYRARRMLKRDLWQHAKTLGFVKDRKHGM